MLTTLILAPLVAARPSISGDEMPRSYPVFNIHVDEPAQRLSHTSSLETLNREHESQLRRIEDMLYSRSVAMAKLGKLATSFAEVAAGPVAPEINVIMEKPSATSSSLRQMSGRVSPRLAALYTHTLEAIAELEKQNSFLGASFVQSGGFVEGNPSPYTEINIQEEARAPSQVGKFDEVAYLSQRERSASIDARELEMLAKSAL